MSISQNFPEVRPTLNLDFANTKVLDPRITFTRGSTGTYVDANGIIQSAAVNEARFDHDPETGESLGLLMEEARTNEFRNSENLSSAQWNKVNVTVTVSSDNTLRSSGVYQITSTGTSPRIHNITKIGGACYSYYVKKVDNSLVSITVNTGVEGGWGHIFNFDTGNFTLVNGGHRGWTANRIFIGNGWWRLWGYTAQTVIYGDEIGIGPGDFRSSAGTQTGSILVTAPQNESGSFITSYIPNTSTSSGVTRSADVASITGSNFSSWYNQNEGTLLAEAKMLFALSGSSFPDIYTTGGYPNRLWILYLNQPGGYGLTVGADAFSRTLATFASSPQSFKVAQSLSNTSLTYSVSKDGGTSLTGGMSALASPSSLSFGSSSGAVKYISRLTYYPVRLPDEQLQNLTK